MQDSTIKAWPEAVQTYVRETYGAADDVIPLSGLSQSHIWRLCFGKKCIVLKQSAEAKEFRFYRDIAPQLVTQDVAIPALLWAEQIDGECWMIVEYLPKTFPRERWLADTAQLQVLRHLHQSQIDLSSEADWIFRPLWDDAMTEAALSFFETDTAQNLRPFLKSIQMRSQALFQQECWISGDPNPMNWGLRDDDTVVLFDWERFGRGTPALDLAIVTPGLATAENCQKVAAGYLETDSSAIELLARQITQAKVWNVVEFLSMAQAGDVAEMRGVESLVNRFPAWLESISIYTSS